MRVSEETAGGNTPSRRGKGEEEIKEEERPPHLRRSLVFMFGNKKRYRKSATVFSVILPAFDYYVSCCGGCYTGKERSGQDNGNPKRYTAVSGVSGRIVSVSGSFAVTAAVSGTVTVRIAYAVRRDCYGYVKVRVYVLYNVGTVSLCCKICYSVYDGNGRVSFGCTYGEGKTSSSGYSDRG
jgi:hypothetical protein